MMNKRNILIGIVIIVFGLVFVPRVIDRVKNNDISRSESRSLKLDNFEKNIESLPYLLINNERKMVPEFKFINQKSLINSSHNLSTLFISLVAAFCSAIFFEDPIPNSGFEFLIFT